MKFAVRTISEDLRTGKAVDGSNIRVTTISPGTYNTELVALIKYEQTHAGIAQFYEQFGVTADHVALTIKQPIDLPEDSAWNEVIIRPTKQVM